MRLRKIDELSDLERMALIKLSYSRLNTFDICEAQYFHGYIIKEPQEFGAAAVLGNVIHSVLEDTVGEPLVYADMIQRYDHYLERYDSEGRITDSLIEAGAQMIGEFVDRHEGDTFNVVDKEMSFELVIGSAWIRGFIDLVVNNSRRGISIVDYKSGKSEVTTKDAPQNLQLGIYALAIAQKLGLDQVYAELYYLRSGRRKGHMFTQSDLEDVYDKVLAKVNKLIGTNNFNPTQTNVWACNWCDYAKPEICKIGYIRKEKATRR